MGTQPPPATAPAACTPPVASSPVVAPDTLRVRWEECEDDGGDEIYQYVLEIAPVDVLRPE